MMPTTTDAGNHPRGSSPPPGGKQRRSAGMPSTGPGPGVPPGPPAPGSASGPIRIIRMNTDKTRRVEGAAEYDVYFELSEPPPHAWRDVFLREWRALAPEAFREHASIEAGFLVLRCRLDEVGTVHLPVLQRAVAAADAPYRASLSNAAAATRRREDVWSDEREAVEKVAGSLRFE